MIELPDKYIHAYIYMCVSVYIKVFHFISVLNLIRKTGCILKTI